MKEKIIPEWSKKKNPNEVPSSMVWIAKEARLAGLWIYHKTTKKWYTPDEFEKNARFLYHERHGKENTHEFAIMSPIAGLNLRLQTLKKVSDEIDDFKKRIDDYYTIEVKKKK